MVGYRGESQAETDATFAAAAKMSDYPIISPFEPRRGTPDFRRSKQENDLPGGDMFYHNTVKFIPSKAHVLRQYRLFYSRYLLDPKQLYKLLRGSPTEQRWFRNLYGNIARSVLSATPAKIAHPWTMVRDIYK